MLESAPEGDRNAHTFRRTTSPDAHKAIREDPFKKDEEGGDDKGADYWKKESKKYRTGKLTHAERKKRVQERIAELKEE